jgi:hypothetical protein
MRSFLRPILVGLAGGAALAACSSSPSMDLDAPVPTDAESICAVRHPCKNVSGPTPEETELCVSIFADTEAACRAENTRLFVCSMRAARCTVDGDIDDEATISALMKHCDSARNDLERCCDTLGDAANVHCGLFHDEGDPMDDEEAPSEPADDAGSPDADSPDADSPDADPAPVGEE